MPQAVGDAFVIRTWSELVVVDALSGSERRRIKWDTEGAIDPATASFVSISRRRGTVDAPEPPAEIVAIDVATGVRKWSISGGDARVGSGATLDHDQVIFGLPDGSIRSLTQPDGALRWTAKLEFKGEGDHFVGRPMRVGERS